MKNKTKGYSGISSRVAGTSDVLSVPDTFGASSVSGRSDVLSVPDTSDASSVSGTFGASSVPDTFDASSVSDTFGASVRCVKCVLAIFVSAVLTVILLSTNAAVSQAGYADYLDVKGHWAENTLRQAYNDGLIVGEGNLLSPNADITTAQVLTILCRVLGVETSSDLLGWGLSGNEWYYDSVAKAAYMDWVSMSDVKSLTTPVTRQNAFYLLAEAFQLIEAKPDISVLNQFSDFESIAPARRQAMASLVSQGLIAGYGGKLQANSYTTRAEIMALLYRIIEEYLPASGTVGNYTHGVMLKGSALLSGNSFSRGLWFNCAASDISLIGVNADRIVIRSQELNTLVIGDSSRIDDLTLATQSGNVTVTPDESAMVKTLVIGTGRGQVTVSGIRTIEVTGSSRRIVIADNVDRLIVSGRHNTIFVQNDAQVGKIELLRTAPDSRIVVDGTVGELEIIGLRAIVEGDGYADTLILSSAHSTVNINYGKILDIIDQGIIEASVKINMPNTLPAGETLKASASIENVAAGKRCLFTWYVNNVPVMENAADIGGEPSVLSYSFAYSRTMNSNADIRVVAKYETAQGERQEIFATRTIKLVNYGKQYWMQFDTQDVLNKVTTNYKGDYTLDWALKNDYDDYEKEVWVYANGYTSTSEYLLWINLAYQRVNIFKRVDGNWELIRKCIVGTGAMGSQTKRGVTTVTYRQLGGWTTREYTVKPVVRFWPGTGYAFHSRLYYPNTNTLSNQSIGFPVSKGCIRMYDEDIWYIYDNIPNGSTVVVY